MRAHEIDPHVFVILGATGDLARRKLLPALAHARAEGYLSDQSLVLGAARSAEVDTNEDFRSWVKQALAQSGVTSTAATTAWIERCFYYHPLNQGTIREYELLSQRITLLEKQHRLPGNRVFYLALPPTVFSSTIEGLSQAGLNHSPGWARVVVEKPFGRDLSTAKQLNHTIGRHFDETQVYRIDHYLGKLTVQNVLVFRFANAMFESLWNRDRIDHVQITVAEPIGVEHRAEYYEQAGALRDMVQNHLTQLVTLMAMEIPVAFEANAIRDEKLKVLRSIRPPQSNDVVFGQYQSGTIHGRAVAGYREEPGVAADSQAETFVAAKLSIDNWRWHGVPFYLRTGKRLPRQLTQIAVTFRQPPISLFKSAGNVEPHANVLLMTLQPDEGFSLSFDVKSSDKLLTLETQSLHFSYQDAYPVLPDAYETLILDVMSGDQTRFVRADVAETSWQLYAPLLQTKISPLGYTAGTWGPREAAMLPARDGRTWRNLNEDESPPSV
jgi:glucose-6-phosphate 1-dehydrogenase